MPHLKSLPKDYVTNIRTHSLGLFNRSVFQYKSANITGPIWVAFRSNILYIHYRNSVLLVFSLLHKLDRLHITSHSSSRSSGWSRTEVSLFFCELWEWLKVLVRRWSRDPEVLIAHSSSRGVTAKHKLSIF